MPSTLLVATSMCSALAIGLVLVFFRSLQGPLQEHLQLSEDRLNRFHTSLILAWVPLMPLAGWFIDHWGLHEVLFTGSLGLGLSVAWLGLCQNAAGLRWGLLGVAITGACVTTAGVALMPTALTLFPTWSLAAALCLGFVFVGLASLMAPRFVPWLVRKWGFRQALLCLGFLCLVPGALVAIVKAEIPQPAPGPLLEASFLSVQFGLIALIAFFYFPLEHSLATWPRPYLAEIGYAGRSIFRLLVGFWCAFLLFRFGLAWMIRPGTEAWLILTLLVVSSMIMGNLAGAYAPSSGYIGFWLIGGCYGPLLPTLLAMALHLQTPLGKPGEAVGILFALSALSSLVVQPLFVSFAKTHGARECMRIPMLLGLVMAAPMLVLALIRFGR